MVLLLFFSAVRLMEHKGVGPVTALAFLPTLRYFAPIAASYIITVSAPVGKRTYCTVGGGTSEGYWSVLTASPLLPTLSIETMVLKSALRSV